MKVVYFLIPVVHGFTIKRGLKLFPGRVRRLAGNHLIYLVDSHSFHPQNKKTTPLFFRMSSPSEIFSQLDISEHVSL